MTALWAYALSGSQLFGILCDRQGQEVLWRLKPDQDMSVRIGSIARWTKRTAPD